MKVVIATPLYPPDIADPAPYVKELAQRLVKDHSVTIITYGRMPEVVPGVVICAADKGRHVLVRLIRFTTLLWRAVKGADVLYLQSGSSAEVPAFIVWFFQSTKILIRISVEPEQGLARHILKQISLGHAVLVETDHALIRPEILPFTPYPSQAMADYESAWDIHLKKLLSLI